MANKERWAMCLAIPSKIVKIENNVATIDVDGVRREASLLLIENPMIGDYVIVHAGFAINKLNEEDAKESLKLLREAVSLTFDDQNKGTDSD
jgi:hydrogenase expression/formation protein HypC